MIIWTRPSGTTIQTPDGDKIELLAKKLGWKKEVKKRTKSKKGADNGNSGTSNKSSPTADTSAG